MTEIPSTIDGATVLRTADIRGIPATGFTQHFVGSENAGEFAGLAIARYEGGSSVYLFYCDPDWQTVTDTLHESVEAAEKQAMLEFGDVQFREHG